MDQDCRVDSRDALQVKKYLLFRFERFRLSKATESLDNQIAKLVTKDFASEKQQKTHPHVSIKAQPFFTLTVLKRVFR